MYHEEDVQKILEYKELGFSIRETAIFLPYSRSYIAMHWNDDPAHLLIQQYHREHSYKLDKYKEDVDEWIYWSVDSDSIYDYVAEQMICDDESKRGDDQYSSEEYEELVEKAGDKERGYEEMDNSRKASDDDINLAKVNLKKCSGRSLYPAQWTT